MVKNSKKSKGATAANGDSAEAEDTVSTTSGKDKPVAGKARSGKPAKASAGRKPVRKRTGGSAEKSPAGRKPRAATAARKTSSSGHAAVSDEDIRLRAYFISEQRMQSGLPGDSAHDWLEARRQLQEEAGKHA